MSSSVVERHKTALRRSGLSRPLRIAIEDGFVTTKTSVFDYGCGRGGDLQRLRSRGVSCTGWDPEHRAGAPKASADVVNLGFVVNVIERPGERAETLSDAWRLTRELLVVSAQLEHDMRSDRLRPYSDGFLTRSNTFHKYFSQSELQTWIEATLSTTAVAAAPGIFYVFRDRGRAEDFAAERLRRSRHTTTLARAKALTQKHEHLVESAMRFFSAHGRFPADIELDDLTAVLEAFGSTRRFHTAIRKVVAAESLERVARERAEDLLIYVAISRFSRRPKFGDLSSTIQLDIKAHFGSYRAACDRADAALLSLGDMQMLRDSCNKEAPGKLMPRALYVHRSAIGELPLPLRLYEACASSYLGDIDDANIVKLSIEEPKISYLSYPGFEKQPHPALARSLSVSLQTFRVRERDYSSSSNPPILHRKEMFIAETHPLFSKFERLTKQEERFGLYEDSARIGTQLGWQECLDRAQLALRGHRVVRSRRRIWG